MRVLAILLCLACAPAVADEFCHDLWFTRNALFDRAGYCFGSALGQAVFDNSDCVTRQPALDPAAQAAVAQIKAMEARVGCRVNTAQGWLDLDDLHILRQLIDLPIPDELGSGCLGWQGPVVPLHSGHSPNAPVIGRIAPGDYVLFDHWPVAGWSYVTTHGPNFVGLTSGGWVRWVYDDSVCASWAG